MTAHISEDGRGREESVAEHTRKTAYLCREKGARCGLAQIMALCGICHDMGKCKKKFDEYIHADAVTKQKLRGTIAHASTGAKYVYDSYHGHPDIAKIMVEMISYAIAAHHGIFDCVDIDHTDIFTKKVSEVEDYDEACINAKRDYLDGFKVEAVFVGASEEFNTVWNKMGELYRRLKAMLVMKEQNDIKEQLLYCRDFLLSCLQRLILSILIDSDWDATSDFMDNVDTLSKKPDLNSVEVFQKAGENFEKYMQGKQKSFQPEIRTEKEKEIFHARNVLQGACKDFAAHPAGIYCLSIPTGGGKTLSGLAYALEYCRCHPRTERIIYVSPYISVTEQNARVFREAAGCDDWILEHHSSVVRTVENEDERAGGLARYEINWAEPFICTTFVQFMNTLFSDRSESIRRMHRLVNTVVIIDEIQSMPPKCVHTFNYMINFLNAVCNTDIILCTATQPALEQTKCPICYSTPKDMIANVNDWFYKFERVKIIPPDIGRYYTFESLGEELVKQSERFHSILVVLNTKSAVRKLYDILKSQNVNAVYLTTNLCAQHRSDKIEAIQKTLSNPQEKIVVISTNLIEAGVDISFECVYRSMAGLDSLAQSAGRCNRNGELEYGVVYLIQLEGENTGNMEELRQNTDVTGYMLYQYGKSDKADTLLMPYWMEKYYMALYAKTADKMNFPLPKSDTNIVELLSRGFGVQDRKNFMNQAFKTAGQAYRVIDDHSFGVIVPYMEGENLIDSIQNASELSEIKSFIRQAQRYTVNVRESQLKNFEGLIQPVCDHIPNLYMVAAPGAYNQDYGITQEWETLIF